MIRTRLFPGATIGAFAAAIFLAALTGCHDPYSQKRIRMRTAHLSRTVYEIERREAAGTGRVEEAGKTLQKWWRNDNERFGRKAPTIGDYIW